MKKQSSRLPANHMLSEIVSGLQKSRSAAHQNILRSTPIVPRPPPQYSEEKREKECKKEEQNSGANEKREEREAGVSDKGIVNAPLPNPKRRFGDGIVFWEPWNVSGGTTRNSGSQLFLCSGGLDVFHSLESFDEKALWAPRFLLRRSLGLVTRGCAIATLAPPSPRWLLVSWRARSHTSPRRWIWHLGVSSNWRPDSPKGNPFFQCMQQITLRESFINREI